ncbi:hypothetical protein KIN20_008164 [Parelaphostrongylus tenuis]|uniref:Uncharacterized protein n=1 Tax=Parelaphostrongylus tenuis TaxID=148309 RepID=A0AAD5MMF1_PARTN|nr:hypothetical protein KIN20_008164 [Parelaphostrongylus tenuis]
MESGSVFDFVGSVTMMRFKVTLIKKDFNNLDNIVEGGVAGMFTSHTVDELKLQWQQKVPLHTDQVSAQNEDYNDRDEYVVCRITLLNERSLIFEPRLTHNGYRIQSKIGEYRVVLQVWDDNFTSIAQPFDRMILQASAMSYNAVESKFVVLLRHYWRKGSSQRAAVDEIDEAEKEGTIRNSITGR